MEPNGGSIWPQHKNSTGFQSNRRVNWTSVCPQWKWRCNILHIQYKALQWWNTVFWRPTCEFTDWKNTRSADSVDKYTNKTDNIQKKPSIQHEYSEWRRWCFRLGFGCCYSYTLTGSCTRLMKKATDKNHKLLSADARRLLLKDGCFRVY